MLTEVALPTRRPSDRSVRALFVVTSFLGSGLLFAVEPMVARMLLPRLGGSPSVWTTALVFFQVALLAGYWLAHVLCRRVRLERHLFVQIALLLAAGATLPVAIPRGWVPPLGGTPVWWTLGALVVIVGAPFVILSSASPTLQRWLAGTDHHAAHDPYFLYAAGNAGSLVGLLAYPFLIEPAIGLKTQSRVWAAGYGVLVACTIACALVTRVRAAPGGVTNTHEALAERAERSHGRSEVARWIGLAAIPSALLVGVTRHISTDVAAIPLLWIAPLSLYLLSFVFAFGTKSDQVARVGATATLVAVIPMLWVVVYGRTDEVWEIGLHLLGFAAVACAAHGRLAVLRPPAGDLSRYYLALSLGGVVGGTAAAIMAPLVFNTVLEYPMAFAAGLLAVPGSRMVPARSALLKRAVLVPVLAALFAVGGTLVVLARLLVVGVIGVPILRRIPRVSFAVLLAFAVWQVQTNAGDLVYADRTFFGALRVSRDGDLNVLKSGTTVHGAQIQRSDYDRYLPLTYYTRRGPIGQTYAALSGPEPLDVGVVGLGAGTLASYARPDMGDALTFYEIDAAMIRIARDPELFSYLSDIDVEIQLGDGRLLLERAKSTRHDLLVIDAFSSDAIPVHLLTREAFEIYASRIAEGGMLAVHVSNRFFDLAPEVAALGEAVGLDVLANHARGGDVVVEGDHLAFASEWVVLSADRERLDAIAARGDWKAPEPADEVWTDDHADLLSTLRW